MAHRPATRTTRRQIVPRKNVALLRWIRKFAEQPKDRGEQWWDEFETMLRQTRTRFRPTDA